MGLGGDLPWRGGFMPDTDISTAMESAVEEGPSPGQAADAGWRPAPAWEPESEPQGWSRAAFLAGWLMAQLYGPVIDGGGSSAGHLPSVSELPEAARVDLSLRELEVALSSCAAGISYPQDLEAMKSAPRSGEWHAGFRDALMGLHRLLIVELTVRDPRLGRAFCLGRSLSDTASLPADLATFTQRLDPYRVAELDGWLADLPDLLGHDAVTAVRGSLRTWSVWAADPFTGRRRLDWVRDGENVELALRRQGAVWRDLLSGERDPALLLTAEAYIGAADIAVRRVGSLARQVLARFWCAVVFLLAVAGGLVYLSVAYAAGTAKFWGVFAAAVGGSGVLLQWVRQSVSNLAQRSELPLWQAERDDALQVGATRLPVGATSGRVRRRAVPREFKPPTIARRAPPPRISSAPNARSGRQE